VVVWAGDSALQSLIASPTLFAYAILTMRDVSTPPLTLESTKKA